MSSPEDDARSQGVSSIRSRFEHLAASLGPDVAIRAPSPKPHGYLVPVALESHSRSSSPSSSYDDARPWNGHARTTSSSSLNTSNPDGTRRKPPPPPPPPRGTRSANSAEDIASPPRTPTPVPLISLSEPTSPEPSASAGSEHTRRPAPPPPPSPRRTSGDESQAQSQPGPASDASSIHSLSPQPSLEALVARKPPLPPSPKPPKPPPPASPAPGSSHVMKGRLVTSPPGELSLSTLNLSIPYHHSEGTPTPTAERPPLPPRRYSPPSAASPMLIPLSDSMEERDRRSPIPPPLPSRIAPPLTPTVSTPSSSLGPSISRSLPPPPKRHSSIPAAAITPAAKPPSAPAQKLIPPPIPPNRPAIPAAIADPTGERTASAPPEPAPNEAARKPLIGKLPPPPVRTIVPGAPLPRYRPGSDESSAEESGGEATGAGDDDAYPDGAHASRRPPIARGLAHGPSRVVVAGPTFVVLTAGGTVLVCDRHEVRAHDLTRADAPVLLLDLRALLPEWRSRDTKVTAAAWRAGAEGTVAWLGTAEGGLLEMDVRTGMLGGTRAGAHSEAVSHIFAAGRTMVTLDGGGKSLVFAPAPPAAHARLTGTQARVVRVAERQEFAALLGGLLWSAARSERVQGVGRGPLVRITDVLAGTTPRGVLPRAHLGAVLCGGALGALVYLGHEGGHVSVWDTTGVNVDIVRLGVSDVQCIEPVAGRLWAGGRGGSIGVFDVAARPWTLRNSWTAHGGSPIARIVRDGHAGRGHLRVASVGKDESLRFWDGLLGVDWVEQELSRREPEFASFRGLRVVIFTWNVDSARPDALTPDERRVFTDALAGAGEGGPDLLVFGLQEVVDLESRRMMAKTVTLGSRRAKAKKEDAFSEHITGAYRRWHDALVDTVRGAGSYALLYTDHLVGLFSCVFIKTTEAPRVREAEITTIKRGMGGRYGNKGSITARLLVDDSSLCFLNCHLAAGQEHVRQRNRDVAAILDGGAVFNAGPWLPFVNGGDGSMVLDHEIVFLNGDLNYRIALRREAVTAAVAAGDFEYLHAHDQLLREQRQNRGFRLRAFAEAPLAFAPTYKYDARSDAYDSSEKRRVPAWCDRVLWRACVPGRVTPLAYGRHEVQASDHRPVSAAFEVMVRKVDSDARARVRREVEELWKDEEARLLAETIEPELDAAAH